MTREEIMELGIEDLETRANEIAAETAEADKETLETLSEELDAIAERRKALNLEIETRKKAAEAVAKGDGEVIEERKDDKKMTDMEIRNSHEYIEAYVDETVTAVTFRPEKTNGSPDFRLFDFEVK